MSHRPVKRAGRHAAGRTAPRRACRSRPQSGLHRRGEILSSIGTGVQGVSSWLSPSGGTARECQRRLWHRRAGRSGHDDRCRRTHGRSSQRAWGAFNDGPYLLQALQIRKTIPCAAGPVTPVPAAAHAFAQTCTVTRVRRPTPAGAVRLLKCTFGLDEFRPGQEAVNVPILGGHDFQILERPAAAVAPYRSSTFDSVWRASRLRRSGSSCRS
jgi:hypothetical protein